MSTPAGRDPEHSSPSNGPLDNDPTPAQLDPFPVVGSERIYDSRWCGLRKDRIDLGDGEIQDHHVFEVTDAVVIVPVLPDGRLLLLWQYRHPLGHSHWELPAGRMHEGEEPERAAERELAEETGHRARRLERVQGFFPINGISRHHAHVFLAHDCLELPEGTDHESSERMSVHALGPDVVRAKLFAGEIEDGFALVGLFHYFARTSAG